MKLDKALRRDQKIKRRVGVKLPSEVKHDKDAERRRAESEKKNRLTAEAIENLTFEVYGTNGKQKWSNS